MKDQREIRDRDFSLRGRTRRRTDGRVELRDSTGRMRGFYDNRTDETHDANGRLIGRGDQLARLLLKQ